MKIPLVYPKIPSPVDCPLKQCIVFEKLDGTNLHWVWQNKWESFGTRRESYSYDEVGFTEFADKHKLYGAAYYFGEVYADKLEEFFLSKDEYRNSRVVIFTEFFGSNSFAGQHQPTEQKKLLLFDVEVDGRILLPADFLSDFSRFPIAKFLYKGKYSGQLVEDIRNGKYPVKEGAVIKGVLDDQVYMCKVKTNAYLDKLKSEFGDRWEEYGE